MGTIVQPITRRIVSPIAGRLTAPSGGPVGAPAVFWDPAASHNSFLYADGNLTVICVNPDGSNWECAKATYYATRKIYFEVLVWGGGNNTVFVGLSPSTQDCSGVNDTFCGKVANSVGYLGATGDIYVAGSSIAVGPTFDMSGTYVIGVAHDPVALKSWFSLNNAWILSGNPATGANPTASGLAGNLFPSVASLNNGVGHFTGRFKTGHFAYTPPAGFFAIGS